jgi:hypothetical protein
VTASSNSISRHCQHAGLMTSSPSSASSRCISGTICDRSSALHHSRPSDERINSVSTQLQQRCTISSASLPTQTPSPTSPPPSLQQQQHEKGTAHKGGAGSSCMVRSASHSAAMKMTPSSTSLDGSGPLRNSARYPGVQSPTSLISPTSIGSGGLQPHALPKARFLFCEDDEHELSQQQQQQQQVSPTQSKSLHAIGANSSGSGTGSGSHGGSTKKRFVYKKIIGSLRRSKSAGSTRDVPAHALFLQYDVHAAMHHSQSQVSD